MPKARLILSKEKSETHDCNVSARGYIAKKVLNYEKLALPISLSHLLFLDSLAEGKTNLKCKRSRSDLLRVVSLLQLLFALKMENLYQDILVFSTHE